MEDWEAWGVRVESSPREEHWFWLPLHGEEEDGNSLDPETTSDALYRLLLEAEFLAAVSSLSSSFPCVSGHPSTSSLPTSLLSGDLPFVGARP